MTAWLSHQLGVGMPSSGSLLCACVGAGVWGGEKVCKIQNKVAKIQHKYHKHHPQDEFFPSVYIIISSLKMMEFCLTTGFCLTKK